MLTEKKKKIIAEPAPESVGQNFYTDPVGGRRNCLRPAMDQSFMALEFKA